MRLESNDSLRLRHQVLQDAQTARDSSSSAAARARTQSLPSRPAALYDGIEVVPDTDAVRTRSNQTAPPTAGRFATGGRATPADNASIRSKKSFAPSQRPRLSKFLGGVGLGGVRGTACDPKYLVEQLCQACKDGDLEWARTEVDKGADVNGLDSKCSPPLYYAVLGGELSIAKLLVEHGALVGGSDGQSSAMVLYAVRRSDIPMLSYLLEHSAPVSGTCLMDKNRRVTPLELAVENGSVEAVKLLLDYGADVHGGGGDTRRRELNPLCSAVDRRHPEVVKVLLNYQARLNGTESTAKWASQVAAIHVAAYRGFEDILDILLQAGADTSVTCQRDGATGVTALHLATSSCAEMLIQAGANIRAGDSTNQYPLSGAVRVRDIGSVKALIQHGAPVNAADLRKETALEIACRLFATDARDGHPEHLATYRQIVGELLAAGKASPGSRSRGQITIRDVCKPMLRSQQPPVDGSKLDLMALMGRIIDIVESQAGVPPKPPGLLREVFGGLVENSVLALIVNKPPA
ncbi:ankyrin repeat-containing domain protein [Echria macrotheca]|uniref:Ankyrin repeat-containing domain protein n=1 Tax=Echria macrotheca TaxID=438768 RepID=A0AAJ0FGJ9_9PEZI|nr:ankyrin repeat-containing domain protein [Echria macrotheca]